MKIAGPRIRRHRALFALAGASLLWGGAISGTKFALGGFAPLPLLSVELLAATAVLWAALLIRGYRPPGSWWLPLLLGLLEPTLAYLGDTVGLSMTSAVSGGEIDGLESALVVLLAAALLRERLTRPVVLSVLAGLAGLIALAGFGGGGSAAGDLFIAGGVLCAGLYTIAAKRFDDGSDALSLTTWQFTAATVVSLAVTVLHGSAAPQALLHMVAPRFWIAAALTGIGGFALSFLLFNSVIAGVDAGWSAVVLNLIPVFGVAGAVAFLREGVTGREGIGAVLVGASVLYFTAAERREANRSVNAAAGPVSLEQFWPLPFLAEHMLAEERQHSFIPDLDVTGLEHPVVLVREVQEPGLNRPEHQIPPQPQCLADRHPVVLITVNDQHRRDDLVGVQVR